MHSFSVSTNDCMSSCLEQESEVETEIASGNSDGRTEHDGGDKIGDDRWHIMTLALPKGIFKVMPVLNVSLSSICSSINMNYRMSHD